MDKVATKVKQTFSEVKLCNESYLEYFEHETTK